MDSFLLPHQWVEDTRTPLFQFRIPFSNDKDEYGFYFISIVAWVELLSLMVAQSLVGAVIGSILYKLVIAPKKENTQTAYLLGYGVILPFWIMWPRFFLPYFRITNLLFKFAAGNITPTVSMFRTTEAIHGYAPSERTTSLGSYMIYFGSPMIRRYKDGKPVQVNVVVQSAKHATKFLSLLLILGLLQSFVQRYTDFCVFGAPKDREEWYSLGRFPSISQWGNNLIQAVMFQLYLSAFGEGFILASTIIFRCQIEPLMDNPVFSSSSPSDFWGRKWNLLVHVCLKRGVFKPMYRATRSRLVAMLSAFAASGLLHEWLIWIIFLDIRSGTPDAPEAREFKPVYGGDMVFFVWQAMLIFFETATPIGRWKLWRNLSQVLPRFVISLMVVTLALPVAHWFLEPYIRSDFFRHAQVLLFMVKSVEGDNASST